MIGKRTSTLSRAMLKSRISFVKSSRAPKPAEDTEDGPVENTAWIRTLTPYADEFARKKTANRVALTMVNPDDSTTVIFTIWERRNPLLIETSDFIIHGEEVFSVTEIKPNDIRPYIDVYAAPVGGLTNLKGEDGVVADSVKDNPPRDDSESAETLLFGEEDDA